MTSSKSDKIILWGGKENTLIPQANTKKLKEENALYEAQKKNQAEREVIEQKIAQIKERGLKTDKDVTKELKKQVKLRIDLQTEAKEINDELTKIEEKYGESANLSSLQARLQKQISSCQRFTYTWE